MDSPIDSPTDSPIDSPRREIVHDFLPLLLVYNDGTVHRFINPPHVPPSPSDPTTAVSSKDIIISPDTGLTARIYLPPFTTADTHKLPILVYFHGGFFCIASAFSASHHRYLNSLSSQANVLAISVEYRLAPEHPLPAAYHDGWDALRWVVSHSTGCRDEPWLTDHGDFSRVFLAGDSSGGNIAHNMAMKAGRESLPNGVRITGVIVTHPFFWGSDPMESNLAVCHEDRIGSRLWNFVYPDCPGGLDDPLVNPCGPESPDLAGLGCSNLLVCVAEKDPLRDRGVKYYEAVRDSEWIGEVELCEAEGEDHVFHILKPQGESTKMLVNKLVSFIGKSINAGSIKEFITEKDTGSITELIMKKDT